MTTAITVPDSVYNKSLPTLSNASQTAPPAGTWIRLRTSGGAGVFYYATAETITQNVAVQDTNNTVSDSKSVTFRLLRKLNVVNNVWKLSNERYYLSWQNARFSGGRLITSGASRHGVRTYYDPRVAVRYDTRSSSISLRYEGRNLSANSGSLASIANQGTTPRTLRPPSNLGPEDLLALATAARAREQANTNGRSSAPPSTSSSRTSSSRETPAVAPPARFTPRPQPAPITVDFGPALQFGPSETELANKPYIMQRFIIPGTDGRPQQVTRRFWLKIIPNSFQYSNVNAAWNEVDRPGNYAITDWAKYNLLKVSFKFLIAADVSSDRLVQESPSSVPLDGLLASIEPELREIRAIAGAPHPVSLVNFQPYLTNTMRFPFIEDRSGAKFVIADMGVTTSRFLPNGVMDASAAEISITLTEFVEATTQLAKLPPIQSQQKPPTKRPPNSPPIADKGKLSWTFQVPIPQQGTAP